MRSIMAKFSLLSVAAMGMLVAATLDCASGQVPSIEANGRDITLNVPDGANVAVSPSPFHFVSCFPNIYRRPSQLMGTLQWRRGLSGSAII